MNLLMKKIGALSPTELNDLFKPIGTSDLPYPSTHFGFDSNGKLEADIGVIADDAHPLAIYSDRSHEYVVGQLNRRMPIPSLLHVQKEAILARAPESKSRVMMIVGKPGAGKSELAKTVADVSDSRGAEIVDCGGHYLSDLLWEQVIDCGEDFKTALTNRVQSGLLTEASVKIFEEQFPEALVKGEDGKAADILWDKIAVPRNKGTKEKPEFESTSEAAERAMRLIESTIAKYEGIPPQTVNSIGMKKVPGIIKRLHDEGRIGLLDEYTKSVEGSDDSLQTLLQYMNGEIDEFTTTNSMKTGGREETYSYTLRRSDMKAGFFLFMTGNSQEDGFSTHMLSKSAYSRLPVFTINEPLPIDWKHRISQVVTGLPLSTLYAVFSDAAKEDPEEFAETLVELRLMGLSSKVPPHQLAMLGGKTTKEDGTVVYNWENTRTAIEKLADFYMYWARIVDPRSDLFDPAKSQNNDNIENVLPEISPSYRDECAIDFRKTIQAMGEALRLKPEVKKIEGGSRLRMNFSAVGRQTTARVARPEQVASELGTRLEAVLLERIGASTVGRPKLREALVKEARERGIIKLPNQQPGSNTLADLLNQDMLASVGGTKTVLSLREALVARLRQANPELNGKSDNDIMSIERAVAASEELQALTSGSRGARKNQIVILGKDTKRVFIGAEAIDGAAGGNKPQASELVSTTDFLESLKIPAVANMNMQGIWTDAISSRNLVKPSAETTPVVQIAEGKHESGIGITTVAMQSADGRGIVPVHVMLDDERGKGLIVTDTVDAPTRSALGKDYTIVSYGDANAEDQVKGFLKASLEVASRKPKMVELEQQLTYAFMLRAGNEAEVQPLARMMTTRGVPAEAPVYIVSQLG
ncbi:MAG: hypothetical protein EOM37_16475 [Proteobacteria bacterium]|nr:hypothetical protein [Pseudomonadota bacterium]